MASVLGQTTGKALRMWVVPNKSTIFGTTLADSSVIAVLDSTKLYMTTAVVSATDNMDSVFTRGSYILFPSSPALWDKLYVDSLFVMKAIHLNNVEIRGDTNYYLTINDSGYVVKTLLSFDGSRAVKRTAWPNGLTPGTTLLKDVLEWLLYPYIPATISIAGCAYFEIGTSNNVTISGGLTVNDETDARSGHLDQTYPVSAEILAWPSGTMTYTTTVSFIPLQGGTAFNTATYVAYDSVGNNGTPIVINSGSCSLSGIYPYFHGFSANDYRTGGTALYSGLTKIVQGYESVTSIELNSSTLYYSYIAYPASYGYLTSIKDQNEFEWIQSYTVYVANVSSTGLVNDWTDVSYNIYRSNNPFTTAGRDWTFTFEHIGSTGASSGTIACSDSVVVGTYEAGTPLTSAETITLNVTLNVPGTYTISTNEVNGYSFSGTGTFTSVDATIVTLTATGTPIASQTDTFTVTYGASNCNFDITVTGP